MISRTGIQPRGRPMQHVVIEDQRIAGFQVPDDGVIMTHAIQSKPNRANRIAATRQCRSKASWFHLLELNQLPRR
jgi:hypothetical protein